MLAEAVGPHVHAQDGLDQRSRQDRGPIAGRESVGHRRILVVGAQLALERGKAVAEALRMAVPALAKRIEGLERAPDALHHCARVGEVHVDVSLVLCVVVRAHRESVARRGSW